MAVERPTFHESWYRVAELHPKLRSTVQISRQHFRGQMWHVVQDHTNNAFFRLAEPAYVFVGLLDGKRSVAEAWKFVNEQLGDDAPTQGEVIQLLGQLYTANLLQAEVPADTHTLFARYKKRKIREITGYLMNIMFARLPLIDPDAFLERWLLLLGWIFSPVGLVVWLIVIGAGCYSIAQVSQWQDKLIGGAAGLLSPENLVLLYVAFAFIKAFHEMGHAISCKKFGRQSGTGGEVHVIGIMFLVFTPVPYVDASSAWALQNKWHRVIVGAAGMWVELAIASVAAMVWASVPETSWLHAFSYNIMFVASFSTIIFNANPLLRYDGYYILSDILEIPNLGQRSNEFIYYLVKKYIWNVRFARNPAYSAGEQGWMFVYAIASFTMRAIVSCSIMFYLASVLNGALILLATVMAVAGLVTWVFVPLGKFLHYLAVSQELARVRTRAILTTAAFAVVVIAAVGVIPFPDRARAEGVVEPLTMQQLFAGQDGFVTHVAKAAMAPSKRPGDTLAVPAVNNGLLILASSNPDLESQRAELEAEKQEIMHQRDIARRTNDDVAKAQAYQEMLVNKEREIAFMDERLAGLELKAPMAGTVVAPELESKQFAFLHRGEKVGLIADIGMSNLIVRAAVSNELGGPLDTEASPRVEIRVNGRPDILLTGHIMAKVLAGTNQLPSAALGYQVGGTLNTAPDDRQGTKTVENFFEVRIDRLAVLNIPTEVRDDYKDGKWRPLLPGQRVVVRFDLHSKPLAVQAWTAILQLFQRKFQI